MNDLAEILFQSFRQEALTSSSSIGRESTLGTEGQTDIPALLFSISVHKEVELELAMA